MLGIFITLFTFILIIVSLFMMLVVLMQRANTNAGMGAAFGGGVADSAFGADTTNVLTRATKWSAVAFFILSSALYLMHISVASDRPVEDVKSTGHPGADPAQTEVPISGNLPAADEPDGVPFQTEAGAAADTVED